MSWYKMTPLGRELLRLLGEGGWVRTGYYRFRHRDGVVASYSWSSFGRTDVWVGGDATWDHLSAADRFWLGRAMRRKGGELEEADRAETCRRVAERAARAGEWFLLKRGAK